MYNKRETTPSADLSVAIVSKQRLVGPVNGSSAYLIALADTFKRSGYSVHLVQPTPAIAGRTPLLKMMPEMSAFDRHSIRRCLRIGQYFFVLDYAVALLGLVGLVRMFARRIGLTGTWTHDRPRPHSIGTVWTEDEKAYVARMVPSSASIVVADYVFAATAFECVPSHCEKVIVMHDLFHSRQGGELDSAARLSRADELALLGRADVVITIQQEEHGFIERELPAVQAILAPMPAQPIKHSAPGDQNRLLFVGSNTAPNTVGLAWFLKHVWPVIKQQQPDTVLDVVGSVCRSLSEHNGKTDIISSGVVPSLSSHYAGAGLVISPLQFGSGLKIKLIEAMAFGKAMVVTPTTLQGVEDVCRGAVCVAEDANAFAAAVTRLQRDDDERKALADNALSCAKRHFSAESVHHDLSQWLGAQRDAGL